MEDCKVKARCPFPPSQEDNVQPLNNPLDGVLRRLMDFSMVFGGNLHILFCYIVFVPRWKKERIKFKPNKKYNG
jgi:hypothetical protein